MKYDLSILIPARNEEFLNRTIEDILRNIEGNTQVIAVLDGYETDIVKDDRVTVIHIKESVGQRAATNQAARMSEAKYVMKCDAHCAFDKGFDVKMIAEMHDDWTMIPLMRNLWVYDWKCWKCGTRVYQDKQNICPKCGHQMKKKIVWIAKTNPSSTSYCFDETPHFQYFNAFKKRPEGQGDLTETMSIQGSCFMLTREKYWELNISDESLGSWGSQGIEVACKTWLSGGKVICNHKTWYAHMFRTKGENNFGFPYPISGKQTAHAKSTVRTLFFDNKWDKQIYPLSWLLDRFWPVPGWSDEMYAKIKAWPLQKKESTKSIGIIYYADNLLDAKIMKACQKQLLKAANGKKIVSVSLKPLEFGQNIVLPLERGYLTMFKQILAGLEALDTDIVFFAEADVLYHPSHFEFVPPAKDIFYYESNYWFLRAADGFAIHYDVSPLSGLCVYRDIAIKHYRERVAMVEKDGFSYNMGFEPMTHNRIAWTHKYKFEIYTSPAPNIDITHGANLTTKRWSQDKFRKKPTNWQEATIDTIPSWDNVKKLLS